MASSYPSGQSELTFASNPNDTTTFAEVYPALYAQLESQPPSPTSISAAAILATLSDSRPPTSHGEDAEDDDETGGISSVEEGQDLGVPHAEPIYYTSVVPTNVYEVIYASGGQEHSAMEYTSHSALDQHAAALEALTMEQLPTPPASTAPPAIPETFIAPPSNSTHFQDLVPSAYEDHLSVQDITAFIDVTSFFHYYANIPKSVTALHGLDIVVQPEVITREDLDGEHCDFQGIDWSVRSTRASIRAKRVAFEKTKRQNRACQGHGPEHRRVPNTDNFFSFRRMNTRHRASFPHFQLRNLMAATSRNDVYYATKEGILRTDASGSPAVPIIDLRKCTVNENPCQITTLAAQNNVLVAGGFEGEYAIANLSSTYDTPFTLGVIRDWSPDTRSYISNHVHLFSSRASYTPQAVLCSNDSRLRVLDCLTNTFRYTFAYPSAVNCSATSPDGRMRVVVGDFMETLITNAETGQPFETLRAHVDDAFACAWADDGVHVATGAQDSTIVVWDARYWRKPVATLPTELSIPRVLRFSPIGSGPRVLIAAEADDYINIINAQTFESKQVFDFIGPTAGVSMTPDGQSLFVANAERRFGGLIELERAGWGEATGLKWGDDPYSDDEFDDWKNDDELNRDRRVPCGFTQRERRGLDLGDLLV